MKKWECDVCGHIYEGEQPPEKCPVCDMPGSAFVLTLEAEKATEAAPVSGRRWRCIVCGYIHEAEEPPEKCPVCAAPKNMFVEIDAEGKEIGAPAKSVEETPAPITLKAGKAAMPQEGNASFMDRLGSLSLKMHLHPIMVHFPNGVLPVVLVFVAIAMTFGIGSLEVAAYYNLIFVLVTLPLVLLSGFLDWQKRYRGARTAIFVGKIIAALIVLAGVNVLVFWRLLEPGVVAEGSPSRYIYLGVLAGTLAAAGFAGYLGGRLVFGTGR